MTKQSKEVERYLKAVGKRLRIAKKEKKTFLEGYRAYILDYIEEEGQPFDYNKLVRFFGTPASVAENYFLTGDGQVCIGSEFKYMQYAAYGILTFFILLCVSMVSYVLIEVLVTAPSASFGEITSTFF